MFTDNNLPEKLDSRSIKCAEVFRNPNGIILFQCLFCNALPKSFELCDHINTHLTEVVSENDESGTEFNQTLQIEILNEDNNFDCDEDEYLNEEDETDNDIIYNTLEELIAPQITDDSIETNLTKEIKLKEIKEERSELSVEHLTAADNTKLQSCDKEYKNLLSSLDLPIVTELHAESNHQAINLKIELIKDLNSSNQLHESIVIDDESVRSSIDHNKPKKCNEANNMSHVSICIPVSKPIKLGRASARNNNGLGFICDLCSKFFTEKGNLRKHMFIHTGERPYKCKICEKSFYHSSYLKIHHRSHTDVKPYPCTLCDNVYRRRNSLVQHMHKHSGTSAKSFICDTCGRAFVSGDLMRIHMRQHTGDRPFGCLKCGNTFTSNSSLKQHMQLHDAQKKYKCQYCGILFAQKAGKRGHERRMHEDDY